MQLTLHTQFSLDLQPDWDALLQQSITHVPFLLFDFQRRWWETRGGGEWDQVDLRLLTADRDGKLAGVAPLFRTLRDDQPHLMLVGSHEVFDYLDFITRAEDLPEFLEDVLRYIEEKEPDVRTLDLYNLIDHSPTLPAIQQAADKLGWKADIQQIQPCPYIPLPGDWETYLSGIDKKQRHEIRRKLRRFEELDGTRWYTVDEAQQLHTEMDAFLKMMDQDNEKHVFLTPEMHTFMHEIAEASLQAGVLHLSFLEIEGQKAAGKFIIQHEGRLLAYNSAVEARFRENSPGWVLLGYLLQWSAQNGIHEFDFMRGNEEYKYRFGAKDRFVMRATLTR